MKYFFEYVIIIVLYSTLLLEVFMAYFLRKENEIIVYGNYELLLPEDENIFAYTRTLDNQKLLVVCNFSKSEQRFDFSGYENAKVLISNYNRDAGEDGILKPYEATVLLLENA